VTRIGQRSPLWQIDGAALLIGIAAAAAVWTMGISPTLEAREAQQLKRASLAPEEARRDALVRAIALQQEQLTTIRADRAANPVLLEPASRINHRLASLTELASDAGLEVEQIAPGPPGAGASVVRLRLTGSGQFPDCSGFLSRLDEAFPDMAVTAFQLAGNPSEPSGQASFVFDLAWHAAPEGQATGREASVPLLER
jgi:Tfp pilus assembly protein PilO